MITLYGFWRSLATYRVRVALQIKGLEFREIPVDLLKGEQHRDEYKALNPQSVLPSLITEEGGFPLFQSMAILEYLEEVRPDPPLLPSDPRGRARVRGLALIAAADGHPLIVPRIRRYLEKDLQVDEARRNRWLAHWTSKALEAIETHLAREPETGRFCHGDAVTMADICVAGQVIAADYFKCDTASVPTAMRIYSECLKIGAFARAHPYSQPGAQPH